MSNFLRPPWTATHQALLSKGLFRQEYWSGLPFLPPGDLPDPGIEPTSPASPAFQADSLPLVLPGKSQWHDNYDHMDCLSAEKNLIFCLLLHCLVPSAWVSLRGQW